MKIKKSSLKLNNYKSNLSMSTPFILSLCIAFALFCSSMLGLQVFGISLNKIGLLPLELYGLYHIFHVKKGKIQGNRYIKAFIVLYMIQIIGSILSLASRDYISFLEWEDRLVNNAVQYLFIYFPIAFFVFSYSNKKALFSSFKSIMIKICRFHAIYVLIQFVLWNTISINITDILINQMFSHIFGSYGVAYGNTGTQIFLRITGLNSDAAFLSILMLIGYCFDKNKVYKILYFASTIFAVSRVGMFSIAMLMCIELFLYLVKHRHGIKQKVIIRSFIGVVILLFPVIVVYNNSPSVQNYINLLFGRILTIFNSDADIYGTGRHMSYPFLSIYSWFFDLNIIERLIGVGIRTEGLVFNHSQYIASFFDFNRTMLTSAWAIECDFASILLGNGIIGMLVYLYLYIQLIKSKDMSLILLGIGLLVFGIMYDVFISTIVQTTLIFIFAYRGDMLCAKKQVQSH